jgi:hypothetical protein
MRTTARTLHAWRCAATLAAALMIVGSTAADAVTCQEVRLMTRAEIAYWAKRLEMSPDKLAALLKRAFCEVPFGQDQDAASLASRTPATEGAR